MLRNERDKYEKFFKTFGNQIKYGIYDNFGEDKEFLQDLVLFYSSTEKKMVTLDEYVSRMKDDQKYIYYATGETVEKSKTPQTELVADKGYEILFFTDPVDEFAIKMLRSYKDKEFKSVSSGDLDLGEETGKEKEAEQKEHKELFEFMKNVLSGKVKDVRVSKRLKTHPVCFSAEGELSIEMEKVLNAMPNKPDVEIKAEKILEINTSHPVFESLKKAFENDKEKLKLYTNLLYNQACLIEGLPVEDPVQFSNDICKIME